MHGFFLKNNILINNNNVSRLYSIIFIIIDVYDHLSLLIE